jgi:hypothetical protein
VIPVIRVKTTRIATFRNCADGVRHYGLGGEAGGALLNRQSYEYQPLVGTEVRVKAQLAQTANNVRLVQVNNGFGGEWRVKYTRTALQIPPDAKHRRQRLSSDADVAGRWHGQPPAQRDCADEEHGNFDGHPRKIYEEFLGFSVERHQL